MNTDLNAQSSPLPHLPAAARQGFRLMRFEVLNWGTFDQQIWHLTVEGDNSLLTGNIGSGKSTLVDGLTTLLVPTRKLAFNKAAGAEDKERSLESYFHGFYTSQQDDYGKARPIGLRGKDHYTVLLAQFHSRALQQSVTLAQVCWLPPSEKKVKRLFLVAEHPLDIASHFTGFGDKIAGLKKRLKQLEKCELFEGFNPYQQAFCKALGLGSDGKALDLFNQTISMKSVGSVTDFVRQNMLAQPDVEVLIQELERNYDDLKRLHDAVVAARQKVELLEPICRLGEDVVQTEQEKLHVHLCREQTDAFMAQHAISLYGKRLQRSRQEHDKLVLQRIHIDRQVTEQEQQVATLHQQILENGGSRLQQLQGEMSRLSQERDTTRHNYKSYRDLTMALALPDTLDPECFISNLAAAKERAESLQGEQTLLEQERDTIKQQEWEQDTRLQQLGNELTALKKRQSNIPGQQLAIRERLCAELGLDESQLPFVGELLQVKGKELIWQGAIERVLHNFALSLLVPERLYAAISEWVEQTHLGSRLVYYRVRQPADYLPEPAAPGSLLGKLEIKPECEQYDWLHKELQRFDYLCCEDLATFRRSDKALTLNGQIKSGPSRHEKDDRHALQDKSRYVLGWSNKEKIQLLAQQYSQWQQHINKLQQQLRQLELRRHTLSDLRRQALNLADFTLGFEQINWPRFSEQIEQLQHEVTLLEQSSDLLHTLQQQLNRVHASLSGLRAERDTLLESLGKLQSNIEADTQVLAEKEAQLASVAPGVRADCFPTLDLFYQEYCVTTGLRIDMLANQSSTLRSKLNDRVQHLEEKRRKKETQMLDAMGKFHYSFPNDANELDKSLAALHEYQQILTQLQQEDLPRHETRFKEMLNRDTIRAMALFRSQLDKHEEEIGARIALINQSLFSLDYQVGTFIEIDRVSSSDVEIREFKQRLKQCVEHTLDDNLYSEQKFEQVKSLIEQMRQDPKWTQKVVDVRFWHLFNVIERYREDGSEKECYSDSGGKSGGQKEKLAYSILAAAILLQYRLVGSPTEEGRSERRFNLVVIDEAFARGSKDSTRFGLELFKKLGLQLLLVTPLQKLDVIEHYVRHVHFVDQKQNRSMLLNMTIEEYRQRLAQHQTLSTYSAMVSEAE